MTSLAPQPRPAPAALEARLLELFAPATVDRPASGDLPGHDLASLWRVDAIHRAKNMAQLSLSLASIATDPADRWGAGTGTAAPAGALARTYHALSLDNDSHAPVPCFEMVSEVAMRLGQIFGPARNIGVHVTGSEVYAAPEQRRALALMCSELVINALKYAFPAGGPGMIAIALVARPDGIELVVADNGVGIAAGYRPGRGKRPGQGEGLLDRLAFVSGAVVARSTSHGGVGLCITVSIRLAASAGGLPVA